MNLEETKKILAILQGAYPANYRDMTLSEKTIMTQIWQMQFENIDYSIISAAVNGLLSISKYAPSIAEVKAFIADKTSTELTEMEAWNLVQKALSNSAYNADTEYEKLPSIIKKVVGSPNMLRSWASCGTSEVNTVIQSNFMRSFKLERTRSIEDKVLPESVKQSLSIRNQMLIKKE